jgi:superfamily II DNA or RNA helicase
MTDKAKAALMEHGNTLCVAPTGAGKTIMLSSLVGDLLQPWEKCLVLQHTDEIFDQNMQKFGLMDSRCRLSKVNGKVKDFSGDVIFAMVQSLQRDKTLAKLPKVSFLVIDEAHHVVAPTYQKVVEWTKENNSSLRILGMTATPMRADNKALGEVFSNVADQITIEELVASGDLLYPKTFVIESDIQEKIKGSLFASKHQNAEYAEDSKLEDFIAEIDQSEIVNHWLDKAQGRKTVAFCSRIDHSLTTVDAFNKAGIKAAHVDGMLNREARQRILSGFTDGDTEVICNVGVLTEGWDYPPTSCILLLRAFSSHAAMVQMIGRGLRTIDKNIYPDCSKTDCVVLDFGVSVSHHGSIESKVDLLPKKKCPACKSWVPYVAQICPFCNTDFVQKAQAEETGKIEREKKRVQPLKNIAMQEIHLGRTLRVEYEQHQEGRRELIKRFLLFSWVYELSWIANGTGGSALVSKLGEKTYAVDLLTKGGTRPKRTLGTLNECCRIAVDFLKKNGGNCLPFEDNDWGDRKPSGKQLKILGETPTPPQTRRQASAMIAYKFFKNIPPKEGSGGTHP